MFKYIVLVLIIFQTSGCEARRNVTVDVILQYHHNSADTFKAINITKPKRLLKSEGYDSLKNTMFYFCGYQENMDWESIRTILSAYLFSKDHNIVMVDWTNMNQGNYFFDSVPNMYKVAKTFAKSLHTLISSGMSPTKVHLVGHSLGGQLVGTIGRKMLDTYGTLLGRVTTLDAAGPVFSLPGVRHAKKGDAKYVDSIHTDAYFMGYGGDIGTADFWPNKGTRHQPGCPFTIPFIWPPLFSPEALCSHWRSWRYWAESVMNPKAFQAKPCGFWKSIKTNSKVINYMGIAADRNLAGDFCLRTSSASPFGLETSKKGKTRKTTRTRKTRKRCNVI